MIDEECVRGISMEGYPPEMHAAVIYRLAEAKIAHVRPLRARSPGP